MDEFAGSFMLHQCDVVPRMWKVAKNYIELEISFFSILTGYIVAQ
jgi:hypothetical protein